MSRLIVFFFLFLLSLSVFAQDLALEGFNQRFKVVRNNQNQLVSIKLKKVVSTFTIKPFLDQLKEDLIKEQHTFTTLSSNEKEEEIDALLNDVGFDPSQKDGGWSYQAQKVKESLLNIPNIDVEAAFAGVNNVSFWKEFQSKLQEAMMFIDPTILANPQDSRFFYRRNVTYKVVEWALRQAQKRFSSVPLLNIATFVIVRVHDMLLEQRHFHHNMLLHYFETIPESKLGLTKEEVDRVVSSIFEYRIDVLNYFESNKAASDWLNYGMNIFYQSVRAGNYRIREWQSPFSDTRFRNIKKLNFSFAQVLEDGVKRIYHLHNSSNMFSARPALAYDYSNPKRVKRNRSLLNLAGVALGFIPIPGWLKGGVDNFIKSFYVNQVRSEGALIGYFESVGNAEMIEKIYSQRANFFILR